RPDRHRDNAPRHRIDPRTDRPQQEVLAFFERPQRETRWRYFAQRVSAQWKQHHQPDDQKQERSGLPQKQHRYQEKVIACQVGDRLLAALKRPPESAQDGGEPSHSSSSTTGDSTRSK